MVSSEYGSVSDRSGAGLGDVGDDDEERAEAELRQHPERDTRVSHTSVLRILCQMFNVLVGTAVFGLPSAVYTSGWLAFVVAQLLLAAVAAANSFYLLQTMQVNAMRPQTTAKDYNERGAGSQHWPWEAGGGGHGRHGESASDGGGNEKAALMSHPATSVRPLPQRSALLGLPHLCSHYGGRRLFYLYEAGVLFYLIFSLWSVCATFTGQASATVMALFLGEDCSIYNEATASVAVCQYAYYGALVLLTVLAVVWALSGSPLSNPISDAAAVFKVVGLFLMVTTVLLALFVGEGAVSSSPAASHSHPGVAAVGALGMLPSDGHALKGVCLALVYALLSYNISFAMAEVFSPQQWRWWTGRGDATDSQAQSATSPATRAALLVAATIAAALLIYLVVGTLCAALFGPRAASLISLHWRQYEGVDFLSTSPAPSSMVSFSTHIPLWARLLQVVILVFPIAAAITSLPYLADAQTQSLTRLLSYNVQHPHSTFILHRSSAPHIPGGKRSVALLAVLPPLVLTAIVGDLGYIFLLTAPVALFIHYVLPAVLLLLTRYGPNAEPEHGSGGRSGSDGRREWYLHSFLVVVLASSSIISIATLILLCLYPLW